MRKSVRAKFRCLHLDTSWGGDVTARLSAITEGRGKDPINNLFWQYTPSGDAKLLMRSPEGDFHERFRPGCYYTIDLSREPQGDERKWELRSVTVYAEDSAEYAFVYYGGRNEELARGEFNIQVDNPRAIETMGLIPDQKPWYLHWLFSEPSDD